MLVRKLAARPDLDVPLFLGALLLPVATFMLCSVVPPLDFTRALAHNGKPGYGVVLLCPDVPARYQPARQRPECPPSWAGTPMQNDGVPCDASFGGCCTKLQYTLKGLVTSAMVVGITMGWWCRDPCQNHGIDCLTL